MDHEAFHERMSAMKLSTLLTVYSATALVICLDFLIVPGFWITLYGATADLQATFLYRLIGALFGGLAVMAWRARAMESKGTGGAMVEGLIIMNALLTLVAVLGALTGVYNRFAWGPVGMFGLFTFGFARVATSRVRGMASPTA